MDKKEKNKKIEEIKENNNYIIIVDALVPIQLTYKIEAEDENKALDKIKRLPDIIGKPKINQAKQIKATVKKRGSNMILATRKL